MAPGDSLGFSPCCLVSCSHLPDFHSAWLHARPFDWKAFLPHAQMPVFELSSSFSLEETVLSQNLLAYLPNPV